MASTGAQEEQREGAAAGRPVLAITWGGDAGRKLAQDAAVWVEELRKFPLLHPRAQNCFLSMAPSTLPPLARVQGAGETIPGHREQGWGHQETLLGQRGRGRESGT